MLTGPSSRSAHASLRPPHALRFSARPEGGEVHSGHRCARPWADQRRCFARRFLLPLPLGEGRGEGKPVQTGGTLHVNAAYPIISPRSASRSSAGCYQKITRPPSQVGRVRWAPGLKGLQPRRRPQRRGLVRALPRELRLIAPEVAVRSGLLVDRAQQIEHLDDAFRAQVEVLAHQLGNGVVADLAGAFGVHGDVHRLGDANRVRHLNLALARQAGGDDVLGHVARGVGGAAVHFRGIFAAEGAAAVRAGTAVGVDDDLAAREATVALRATHHKAAGGVDQVLGVLQPLFRQHRLDDFLDHRLDEGVLHLVLRFALVGVVLVFIVAIQMVQRFFQEVRAVFGF